ncbi:MAG: molybdopterin-synthase adenylyltransferase MoeB [Gammaproteobacteria bacterium]|nr:molybdopterin-synthase adenylyltransferase MoeB [Gammaproteobacteria bacterium]
MNDQELLRYGRHIMLPEIDFEGQQKLLSAKVLIIGTGGLGSPVALYLASSGIGEITIADHDKVELNNLQRQIAHGEAELGQAKVKSCAHRMTQINSTVKIIPLEKQLTGEPLLGQVEQADIIIDCTDKLSTRFEINRACVEKKKWLVSAAAIRWEGQISTYHCGTKDSPCYHCFYGSREGSRQEIDQTCSNSGVLSPIVGVMGSMQAIEVIKLILGKGESLVGRVLLLDAFSMQWEQMELPKNPDCTVCSAV